MEKYRQDSANDLTKECVSICSFGLGKQVRDQQLCPYYCLTKSSNRCILILSYLKNHNSACMLYFQQNLNIKPRPWNAMILKVSLVPLVSEKAWKPCRAYNSMSKVGKRLFGYFCSTLYIKCNCKPT